MSNVEELIEFIKTLTPEQTDKIIRQMQLLTSSIAEPCQPAPQKAS